MWQDFSGQTITQHLDTFYHNHTAFKYRFLSAVSGGYKTPRYTQKFLLRLLPGLVTSVIDQLCLQRMEEAL
jgi:hypothetical protein